MGCWQPEQYFDKISLLMIKLSEHWTPYHPQLPAHLREWVLYSGSFMTRLRESGINDARVKVLKQQWQFPVLQERKLLDIPHRSFAWVREVFILNDKKIWMFARTVFPHQTLTGKGSQLMHLKNRSLGSVLFKDPTLQRSAFEITPLFPKTIWYEKITKEIHQKPDTLWARRSTFHFDKKKLLLTEIFFPDSYE